VSETSLREEAQTEAGSGANQQDSKTRPEAIYIYASKAREPGG
jgi:hypothetical protein